MISVKEVHQRLKKLGYKGIVLGEEVVLDKEDYNKLKEHFADILMKHYGGKYSSAPLTFQDRQKYIDNMSQSAFFCGRVVRPA